MRVRRRYLALKIESNEKIFLKDFIEAVWSALSRLYGEYGASKAGLTPIDYDAERGFAIIRVFHAEVEKVRAAVASITEITNKPVAVHVINVSGTVKALRRKLNAGFSGS